MVGNDKRKPDDDPNTGKDMEDSGEDKTGAIGKLEGGKERVGGSGSTCDGSS